MKQGRMEIVVIRKKNNPRLCSNNDIRYKWGIFGRAGWLLQSDTLYIHLLRIASDREELKWKRITEKRGVLARQAGSSSHSLEVNIHISKSISYSNRVVYIIKILLLCTYGGSVLYDQPPRPADRTADRRWHLSMVIVSGSSQLVASEIRKKENNNNWKRRLSFIHKQKTENG